ncbi:sensor histidine kinase [Robiginitalea sediminis]|uniref:sensor histidine kinase n=1 Tax=Robiginitalea sediminis TaxID=1982593 RepID=UPI000B4B19C9|nr:HAMP domain-containing sensor histidine kinase [Robiginitalea sediminis]
MKAPLLSNRLIKKLVLAFLGILVLASLGYALATIYFTNQHYNETTQRVHASLAQDLIDEKFLNESPIDSLGNVNQALFGDIMHDMMAVNKAIEVYLLDMEGQVQYSVVLDHDSSDTPPQQVSLSPIKEFIKTGGERYVLGDDPRNPGAQKIFSAARFNRGGKEGYIYIILAGEDYLATKNMLLKGYGMKLGLGISLLTLLFAAVLTIGAVMYLTQSLRKITYASRRFQEGDLHYRIENAERTDLAGVACTYNEMAETILKDIEQIKSLEGLRRELIANISHDLRTPLAVIQGYIETLQMKYDTLSPKEREHYLNTINQGCARLSKLIAQLFEYSKLEANQVVPQKEPFLIGDLANDLYLNYKLLAEKKGIRLHLEMDDAPPLVFADISMVERAIQNLMDNALKFTPAGGVVTLKILGSEQTVEISIRDTGPGIRKEEQALIFERYRQIKSGSSKEGAGLGLAIVRKIIELHNASIRVLSQPNEGTVFSFELPVYPVSQLS